MVDAIVTTLQPTALQPNPALTSFRLLLLAAFVVLLAAMIYFVIIAPRRLRRTDIEVAIPGLAPEFDGYTIAVLSDLHYGGVFRPRSHAQRAAAIARSADPDLVALLGDYGVSVGRFTRLTRYMYDRGMRELGPILKSIGARDGMLAVLGNHDYDTGGWRVVRWLSSIDAGVLLNQAALLERNGAKLAIGGVRDPHYARVDPEGGFSHAPPDAPRILLSHTPDAITLLSPAARPALVLAGHTHGGQVVLPFVGALSRHSRICGRRTASGWIPDAPFPLYVTTGVGVAIPVRAWCRGEVLIVRLVSRAP
ncbi:MAG TPA: metallophosphoesterase [Gemmatimonadaceae bacterium]|nr:metallophosphoesterase [Gemmatimonadaceae bacterium]